MNGKNNTQLSPEGEVNSGGIAETRSVEVYIEGLSAGTGKLCIFGHLGLVFIWNCFVFRLLFLLYYVICAPVLTEGTYIERYESTLRGIVVLVFTKSVR